MKYLIFLILLGCAAVNQQLDPSVSYRKDIKITANKYQGDGTLVVPYNWKYEFEFYLAGKADLFTFQTCHRELVRESAGEGGIFSDKRTVRLTYVPTADLETKGSCLVDVGGYSIAGQNSWALIDFESIEHTLPARIKCNGSVYNSNGVTICQAREHLLQEISFSEDVEAESKCNIETKDKKTYRYSIEKNKCLYLFMSKEGKLHKLTTFGYTGVLIRGE